jgi:broad specificity phosphatase PhoE
MTYTAAGRRLVLVKHALPVLDGTLPARQWVLGKDGSAQAVALAAALRRFLPFRLVSSTEAKAAETGRIVAAELDVAMEARPGLEELDRRTLPIMSPEEHARLNARIFAEPATPVLGRESADEAVARFTAAVAAEVERGAGDVVIITHGTVISLLVARHNMVDAFSLWRELDCASYVVLQLPSLMLLEGPLHTEVPPPGH